MPLKDHEPRRRRNNYDVDSESPNSLPTHSPRKPSLRDFARARDQDALDYRDISSSSGSQTRLTGKAPTILPEMERRASGSSPMDSRSSLPYPSFSKAHSREAVDPADGTTKHSFFTPDPTDLGDHLQDKRASTYATVGRSSNTKAPPSPPLTATERSLRRDGSRTHVSKPGSHRWETTRKDEETTPGGLKERDGPRFSASSTSLRKAEEGNRISISPRKSTSPRSKKHRRYPSAPGIDRRSPLSKNEPPEDTRKVSVPTPGFNSRSVTDSDSTSVAPNQQNELKQTPLASQDIDHSSSNPRTSNDHQRSLSGIEPQVPSRLEIFTSNGSNSELGASPKSSSILSPPPPPPPPPPPMRSSAHPRVDYLLQNGGLPHQISRSFSTGNPSIPPQSYQQYTSPQIGQNSRNSDIQNVFKPYMKLLDDLAAVMSKDGSVAVATGYRSVARRLLDRLEAVFARNISSEICQCVMCQSDVNLLNSQSVDNGVSWGEVLELVSGRRELPPWPPFSLASSPLGLNMVDLDQPAPMQKLDIDVPEEYRAHYIRQSKKTKLAVQNWLESQPETNVSPPQEVDDETLTFAMLTYLEPEQRPVFTALMRGLSSLPASQAPTPVPASQTPTPAPKPDFMSKIGLALQRLYRLSKPPRDPESSMYLLKNPSLHSALVTLAAISGGEWEILISGRFDGFLWSGAEENKLASTSFHLQRLSSNARATTPSALSTLQPSSRADSQGGASLQSLQSQSRTATPAERASSMASPLHTGTQSPFSGHGPGPGPVQVDEDTEIAVLAEVEREIYTGMEALEDAFEALHVKAENVRRTLRERGAGLAVQAQARKGDAAEQPKVRGMTPGQTFGFGNGGVLGFTHGVKDVPSMPGAAEGALWAQGTSGDSETDDGLGGFDTRSELAPDDSASNVSGRRRRRRHGTTRRSERKTPAPVEEEADE